MKYVFKRILNMNFKKMFELINKINKKSKKNKILLFFDIIFCGLIYQAGYMDYYLFEFWGLKHKDRKTFMTRGKNNKYIKFFNDKNYNHIFYNKDEFNNKFYDFLKREFIVLNNNQNEFIKFCKNKKEIICKPRAGSCGKDIQKINIENKDLKKIYNSLINDKLTVIEEVIKQNQKLQKIYPLAVNTLRVISIFYNNKTNIVAAYVKFGSKGNFVDNFNSGGMISPVNLKNGVIEFPAVDKNGGVYYKHPYTNKDIVNFKLPNWNKVIGLVERIGGIVPQIKMVGWDIAISENDAVLIEGNEFPGHDIYQLPPHRKNNIGMLPIFEKILKI